MKTTPCSWQMYVTHPGTKFYILPHFIFFHDVLVGGFTVSVAWSCPHFNLMAPKLNDVPMLNQNICQSTTACSNDCLTVWQPFLELSASSHMVRMHVSIDCASKHLKILIGLKFKEIGWSLLRAYFMRSPNSKTISKSRSRKSMTGSMTTASLDTASASRYE